MIASYAPQPAPTSATLPVFFFSCFPAAAFKRSCISSLVSGRPLSRQKSAASFKTAALILPSGISRLTGSRNASSPSRISSVFSGRAAARRLLKYAAVIGLAPSVEIPAQNFPSLTSDGKIKPHFSWSSTTLTRIFFSWHNALMCALSFSSSVAAITKHLPSTSASRNGRSLQSSIGSALISSARYGATTVSFAPNGFIFSILWAAILPPPTISPSLPSSSTKNGKYPICYSSG